jgi:hypothetical protein
MKRSFDDAEARRRDALYTFSDDAPWGPLRGAFYRIKLYDNTAATALRIRNVYQRKMLRLVEARQEVKPG